MTRSALALVLVVVAALVLWFALGDTNEEREAAAPAAVASNAAEPRTSQPSAPLAPGRAGAGQVVDDAREAAGKLTNRPDASEAPAAPARITLYGFVRPVAGADELQGLVQLGVADRLGAAQLARASPDGAYSLSGLSPGTYWVNAGAVRGGAAHARVELDERETEKRLDLQLVLAPQVWVKVVDRAGEPVRAFGLLAVATRESPGEWIDELFGSANNPFGAGHFEQNGFGNVRVADTYIGRVVLDAPPPMLVSVVHYQRVIATRQVELGQEEVEFVLDRDSLLLQSASARFRFVDADNGAALKCESAKLIGAAGFTPKQVDGVFTATELPPGWYEIVAELAGYERVHRRVLVEPGVENDWGAIALEREQTLDALVVDDAGERVAAQFLLERIDPVTNKPVRAPSSSLFASDNAGKLHVGGLSRATYALRLHDPKSSWARSTKVFDTRASSIVDLRIELSHGVPLVVQPTDEASNEVSFTIFDAAGAVVMSSRLQYAAPQPIRLALGSYEVEVRIADGEPRRLPVTIGAEPVELALP